jgi:2-dehydro-3-deoxygluconokinase
MMTCFPVSPVDGVIDTTAAGDSFNGAYLAALLEGRSPSHAIVQGQHCAGQVIRHRGALLPFAELATTGA